MQKTEESELQAELERLRSALSDTERCLDGLAPTDGARPADMRPASPIRSRRRAEQLHTQLWTRATVLLGQLLEVQTATDSARQSADQDLRWQLRDDQHVSELDALGDLLLRPGHYTLKVWQSVSGSSRVPRVQIQWCRWLRVLAALGLLEIPSNPGSCDDDEEWLWSRVGGWAHAGPPSPHRLPGGIRFATRPLLAYACWLLPTQADVDALAQALARVPRQAQTDLPATPSGETEAVRQRWLPRGAVTGILAQLELIAHGQGDAEELVHTSVRRRLRAQIVELAAVRCTPYRVAPLPTGHQGWFDALVRVDDASTTLRQHGRWITGGPCYYRARFEHDCTAVLRREQEAVQRVGIEHCGWT